MNTKRTLFAALLLLFAFPTLGQEDEGRAYFSLSTNRTYGSGEKPVIQMWAQNMDALDMRVYRVKDPVLFFQKLEDPHRFGGRAPEPPRELTLLERFHEWKVRCRNRIRDTMRAQFMPNHRMVIRALILDRSRPPVQKTASYANVPLLNSQQLVAAWRQTVGRGSRWETQTIPVPVEGKGLYLVEAVRGGLRAYTILFVSDLAMITKSAPGRIVAQVVNRQSGNPVPGVPVMVWSDKQERAESRSDRQGLVDIPLKQTKPEQALVLARNGDDLAVNSLYGWNLSTDPDRYWTGYVYTDRPVYRPGHTVHFKAIVRNQLGGQFTLPGPRTAQAEIQDPEGKTLWRKDLALSGMGTLHDDFVVPSAAALGYYSVILHLGEGTMSGGFNVEEYKKPEYEVRVIPAGKRVLQGQPIQATIDARYYYGEPVANAKVTWVVHRLRYWLSRYGGDVADMLGEDMGEGAEGGDVDDGVDRDQVEEQTGRLDADGRLTISVPTRITERDNELRRWDETYRIEARVADAGNREISGIGYALATYGSFFVNVQPESYVIQSGKTGKFNIEARDYDGKPVSTPVRVTLLSWKIGGGGLNENPLASTDAQTDAAGKASVEMAIPGGGSVAAHVAATTPENRQVEDTTFVWVTGRAQSWFAERRERLQIVPDKISYKPGEVAKALVITGVKDATLLVTVEGKQIYSTQVIQAGDGTATIESPVRAEYEPEVYITAAFIKNNKLFQGTRRISVPPVDHQLQVEVTPSKPQFTPGEPASFSVTAKDAAGNPAAAEFSIGVVDEAIYAIRPEAAQDIVKFFYGQSYNRVGTESSLSYYFSGEAGKRRMMLTQVRRPGSLAQLKPERLVQPKIRKAFPDTALWIADLKTGPNGKAQANVTFPDSLTTWRATARGVTPDTKVGSAVAKTIVRKNLILSLAVPRFFTVGDQVTVSALVRNYLDTEKTAKVSLDVTGLEIVEGPTRDVTVPSHGQAKVDFRVKALPGAQATLIGKALTNEESDAMELTLPVNPFGVKLADARSGSLSGQNDQAEVKLEFPQNIEPSSRSIEITVAPSFAGAVFGALEYLTTYPYGCTEQTMSSFLPNIAVAQAMKELGVKANLDPSVLARKIQPGLERLYEYQHPEGGWGWWKTDESQLFLTAYVLSGLTQAQAAGYTVRPDVIDRAREWLRAAYEKEPRLVPDLKGYVVYTLAQSGVREASLIESSWDVRSRMTPYGHALLGLTLLLAGDKARAGQAADDLEKEAGSNDQEAWWKVERDTLMDFVEDVTPESTAYALKFLTAARPSSPLLPKAALWLMNHRNEGYYWSSTKQTAMVVYGLTDYLKRSGELKPDFTATVWVNGKQMLTKTFREADALAPVPPTIRLVANELEAAGNSVRITKSGAGRLYWSARAEYHSTAEKFKRAGAISLNVLREYFLLAPTREKEKIVHELKPFQGELRPGDVLAVRLTVSGGPWRYLMLEDPIPAGTEFIERDDLYEIKEKPPWWDFGFGFTRREFHDDRASFFETRFDEGQRQFLYLLKVVNPGSFRVSPARVQPMYQPEYLSTSNSAVVETK